VVPFNSINEELNMKDDVVGISRQALPTLVACPRPCSVFSVLDSL